MFCKKVIRFGIIFGILTISFETFGVLKNQNKEKPSFLQEGEYSDGKYLQFTVDKSAFIWGSFAAVSTRTLVSLAQCGTKFENFKSSVLRPGVVKSMLFWVPMTIGYKYALTVKANQKLQDRLVLQSEEIANRLPSDIQKSERE